MFDVGFWELLVIGVLALLVLGPERLPGALRSTIKTVRTVKNTMNGFKDEVERQLRLQELHDNLKQAEEKSLEDLSPDLKRSVDELNEAAKSVTEPYKKEKDV